MPLVAGVDSSTQSCKVVIRDAVTGALVRSGRAAHPAGTEVAPSAWEDALHQAIREAGGLHDVEALSVAGQQHGLVALDERGEVVRPALLWNDTRSAAAAEALVGELGGGQAWADAVGVVPVASITISKLRWLAEAEPEHAARTASVCLPHDWLTWRLSGRTGIADLRTDRGDASGTGYWSADTGYRTDLLIHALGHAPEVPSVLAPAEPAGRTHDGLLLGPGTGDNAAAALALHARPGDVIVSLGTSGVACAVSDTPTHDGSGTVAGFADATGRFLPLACTLNAAQVLDATARLLGVTLEQLSDLALSAPVGASGAVLIPYLQGERTPNKPFATGALHGLTMESTTPTCLARAAVEGMLCGLADAIDAIASQGIPVRRALLIGGAAQSQAVRRIAPSILGLPVTVPATSESVADGAARQAAWVLSNAPEPPEWSLGQATIHEDEPATEVRRRYAEARELVLERQP
jgi:xylulokinase